MIEHWGYTAVLLGTFIEGEMVLLVAGALVHRLALALPWVMSARRQLANTGGS